MGYSLKLGDLVRAWNPATKEERIGEVVSIHPGHTPDYLESVKSPRASIIEDVQDQIKKDDELQQETFDRYAALKNMDIREQGIPRELSFSFKPAYERTVVYVNLNPSSNGPETDYRQERPRMYDLRSVTKLEI